MAKRPKRKAVEIPPAEHRRNKSYGRRYQENRAKVLARSRVCALRLSVCTHSATETDHIIEASRGGPSTIENLQPVCLHCNRAKEQARKAARGRREKSPRSPGAPSAVELDGVVGNCASLWGGPHDLTRWGGPRECWGQPGHASRD